MLAKDRKEYVISKQLMRSGINPGAMAREAHHAESKHDFLHKLSVAQKEINETVYWLELLYHTEYLKVQEFESILQDATEVRKLLASIIMTTKAQIKA